MFKFKECNIRFLDGLKSSKKISESTKCEIASNKLCVVSFLFCNEFVSNYLAEDN